MIEFLQAVHVRTLVTVLVGIGLSVLLSGTVVRHLVLETKRRIVIGAPQGVDPELWGAAIGLSDEAGEPSAWIGKMEAVLFFVSLWTGAHIAAAGWLTFKVASKWEVWQSIVKVPGELDVEGVDPLDYLAARNRWATSILQRWLIGTLGNALVAVAAVGVALTLDRALIYFGW